MVSTRIGDTGGGWSAGADVMEVSVTGQRCFTIPDDVEVLLSAGYPVVRCGGSPQN